MQRRISWTEEELQQWRADLVLYHEQITLTIDKLVTALTLAECNTLLQPSLDELPTDHSGEFKAAHLLLTSGYHPNANNVDHLHAQLLRQSLLSRVIINIIRESHTNFVDYAVSDAQRFKKLIHPNKIDAVLSRLQNIHSAATFGAAFTLDNSYNRHQISYGAKTLKKMKVGVCADFALLAADLILHAQECGAMPLLDTKIVTHHDQLGSHTFVLVDYPHQIPTQTQLSQNNEQPIDLQDCGIPYVIIDLWAAAMGHDQSNGIFSFADYPFDAMTTKLVCCYNNQSDPEFGNRIAALTDHEQTHGKNDDQKRMELFYQQLEQLQKYMEHAKHEDYQSFHADIEYVIAAALKSLVELDSDSLAIAKLEKLNFDAHRTMFGGITHYSKTISSNSPSAFRDVSPPGLLLLQHLEKIEDFLREVQTRTLIKTRHPK